MIGLDSNVLVRHLTQDDPDQSARADAVLEALTAKDPAYITTTALVETFWVLRRHYHLPHAEVVEALTRLTRVPEIRIERANIVNQALADAVDGFDLGDCLIIHQGTAAGVTETVTFDRRASLLPNTRLL